MELFRTVVNCAVSPEKTGYDTPILMMGSCFTENLGALMKRLKFDIVINPFGTVYHPAPLAYSVVRIISGKPYTNDDLCHYNEIWHSVDHHGRFSHTDASVCISMINNELLKARKQLARSRWLFLTFGSAWAYRLKNNGHYVANCHKLPASDFERFRFEIDQICETWNETIEALRFFNPHVKIVFTVSPIRHLRDGAHENQLSKATLLLAIEKLTRKHTNTSYFPAYEIVLDELRDYRFFDENMTHPSDAAINYIWRRFCETYMDDDAMKIMKSVESIVKAASHNPMHQTSEHRKFVENYLEKIAELKRQIPILDFRRETEQFELLLN